MVKIWLKEDSYDMLPYFVVVWECAGTKSMRRIYFAMVTNNADSL